MKKRLIVITGAGISAESGISTFRDSNGLWENYSVEEVATPEAWNKNPDLVSEFYNQRRKQIIECEPNNAHRYIAALQTIYDVIVITQNIDDLHERAGTSQLIHLHGNIRYAKSSGPNQEKAYYFINGDKLTASDLCEDGFRLRPHVVWFGEEVPEMSRAIDFVMDADYVLIIGTSLNVYPAAGLIAYAPISCVKIVVDPKVQELKLDKSFIQIEKTAVESIPLLEKILN